MTLRVIINVLFFAPINAIRVDVIKSACNRLAMTFVNFSTGSTASISIAPRDERVDPSGHALDGVGYCVHVRHVSSPSRRTLRRAASAVNV